MPYSQEMAEKAIALMIMAQQSNKFEQALITVTQHGEKEPCLYLLWAQPGKEFPFSLWDPYKNEVYSFPTANEFGEFCGRHINSDTMDFCVVQPIMKKARGATAAAASSVL